VAAKQLALARQRRGAPLLRVHAQPECAPHDRRTSWAAALAPQAAPPILSAAAGGKFLHQRCEGMGRTGAWWCCSIFAECMNTGTAIANMAAKAMAVLRRQSLGSAYQPGRGARGRSSGAADSVPLEGTSKPAGVRPCRTAVARLLTSWC